MVVVASATLVSLTVASISWDFSAAGASSSSLGASSEAAVVGTLAFLGDFFVNNSVNLPRGDEGRTGASSEVVVASTKNKGSFSHFGNKTIFRQVTFFMNFFSSFMFFSNFSCCFLVLLFIVTTK